MEGSWPLQPAPHQDCPLLDSASLPLLLRTVPRPASSLGVLVPHPFPFHSLIRCLFGDRRRGYAVLSRTGMVPISAFS